MYITREIIANIENNLQNTRIILNCISYLSMHRILSQSPYIISIIFPLLCTYSFTMLIVLLCCCATTRSNAATHATRNANNARAWWMFNTRQATCMLPLPFSPLLSSSPPFLPLLPLHFTTLTPNYLS